jgi:hypothetical protein
MYTPLRCGVVITEPPGEWEEPDAIGWAHRGRSSILIECKASRADYQADAKKPQRRERSAKFGVGRYRFYMARKGLILADELPEGWGLLEVVGPRVCVRRWSAEHEYAQERELMLLWGECRRIHRMEAGETFNTKAGRRLAPLVALVKEAKS